VQIGEDQLVQLLVIHDDGYSRAYPVQPEFFVEVPEAAATASAEAADTGTRYCICSKHQGKAAIKVQEMMKSRHFLGGCARGRKLLSELGPRKLAAKEDLKGLQMWDPTEAAWFSGHILGMSGAHSTTNWVLLFDDDTEYDINPKDTVWKLVCFPI
jgi:hypothetical protein